MVQSYAYGMVQYKNEMIQCRQLLVDWARIRYIKKQYWNDSLKAVIYQGVERVELR
jgi:hypothetical protein